MDALSHALMGTMVADALPFTKRLGPKAPILATLAAAAPDLDLAPAFIANFPPTSLSFGGLVDIPLAMRFHRAETHSFFYMALAALVLGCIAWRWSSRQGRWWHWSLLLAAAFFSHTILDLLNPYGVRAWLPFSTQRSALYLLPLTDQFFMVVMVGVFILNHLLRDSGRTSRGGLPAPLARVVAKVPRTNIIGLVGVALLTVRTLAAV